MTEESQAGEARQPSGFVPQLHILPAAQRTLWGELVAVPPHFALYGGTGLALHMGHRQSIDFDFFGTELFDPDELLALPFLSDAEVTKRAKNPLGVCVDRGGPVRLSFFGVPTLRRVHPPHICPDTKVRIASLLDLAGTKASVVQVRSELKDYVDIAALIADGRIGLPMALAAAQAIYGQRFNPEITLKALSYFQDGDVPALPQADRTLILDAVRQTNPNRLPPLPSHQEQQNTGIR